MKLALLDKAEVGWFLNCLFGRRDSAHLEDRKCIPFNTKEL